MKPARILVPLDGSKLSAAAVPVAAKLAVGLEADITLLRVVPPVTTESAGTSDLPSLVDLEERRAYEELATFTPAFAGRRVQLVVLVGTRPAEEIIGWVRAHPVDFIVMATHGHGGLRHLVAGSVTEAVLRSGVAPVIAVRPSGVAAAAGA